MPKPRRPILPPLAVALAAVSVPLGACDRTPPSAPAKPENSTAAAPPAIQRTQHTSSGDAILDLSTTVDRTDLTVADRATATFVCTTRPSAALAAPAIPSPLGGFTVASTARTERTDAAGLRTTTITLALEPFLAGDKQFPSLTFQAADAGRALTLATDPIAFHVSPVADAAADASTPLDAPKPPVALLVPPGHDRRAVWIVAIAAIASTVAILASFAAVGVINARRARREADPHIRVRRSLDTIRASLPQTSTRAEASALSERLFRSLSGYLAATLDIPADTQPYASIAPAISTSPLLTASARAELNAILTDLERLRFAPDAASVTGVTALLCRTAAFVDPTALGSVPP